MARLFAALRSRTARSGGLFSTKDQPAPGSYRTSYGDASPRQSRLQPRALRIEVPNSNPPRPAGRAALGPVLRLSALALAGFALSYLVFGYGVPFVKKTATTGPPGMVWIPGGEFTMGTDDAIGWAEEKPAHRVRVDGFWVDQTDVTNAQFRAFVEATGYVTTAEKPVDARRSCGKVRPARPCPLRKSCSPVRWCFSRQPRR